VFKYHPSLDFSAFYATALVAHFTAVLSPRGLLQLAITWYKTRHAGGQAHYYSRTGTSKQRQVKLHWFRSLTIPSQQ